MKSTSNLVVESLNRLNLGDNKEYELSLTYSEKFGAYNANIRKNGPKISLGLSKKWYAISDEIVIGLIQSLLLKILKTRGTSYNIELYNSFIKNLHKSASHTNWDDKLKRMFEIVNRDYFNYGIELTGLNWGKNSKRKLASYNYHTDSIVVSSLFRNAEDDVLMFLLYHEMLHKKLKYRAGSSKTRHHGPEFRAEENKFKNRPEVERKIENIVREKGF